MNNKDLGPEQECEWLPLVDYAMTKGVSLSTLRRHIKAKKICFRTEGGKYFLWNGPGENAHAVLHGEQQATLSPPLEHHSNQEVAQLQIELKKAHEEIAELMTLIAFYEENSQSKERKDGTNILGKDLSR